MTSRPRAAPIPADASFIVMLTSKDDLVPTDGNGTSDVLLRDRVHGTWEHVSIAFDGGPSNGTRASFPSPRTRCPADGRWIAFDSAAKNLVPAYVPPALGADAYIRDRSTGKTLLLNVSAAGVQGNDHSGFACVSADGHFAAFTSSASNLVPGDANGKPDIFVRDLQDGSVVLASRGSLNAPAKGLAFDTLSISRDGRWLAFSRTASRCCRRTPC